MRSEHRYTPDILAPGLLVVFCGINPANTAVLSGHSFSSASNRFWPVLHRAGFTDVQLAPCEERRLLLYRCGITAAVTRATSGAREVSRTEFRQARAGLETKIRKAAPVCIAFLGKPALAAMLGQPRIEWGRQAHPFGGAAAWVLPNPSGLNRAFSLDALVDAYSELRLSLPRLTGRSSIGRA